MTERMTTLLESLSKQRTDSVLITSQANVFYFSRYNSDPHERLIAVYADHLHQPILIVPSMEQQDAQDAGWEHDIIAYQDHENPWDMLMAHLQSHEGVPKQIGLEFNHITMERFNEVTRIMPQCEAVDVQDELANLRGIKSAEEYEHLKKAAELADYGVELGVAALKEGISELEVIAAIEYGLKQRGVEAMSFSTMVLFGPKAASPHGTPGSNTLKSGDMVLFDLGVIHNGYCSDISRTVAFKEINEEQKTIYDTVLNAQKNALLKSELNTSAGEIDQAARDYITEAGYGMYFPHRIGHGLGIETHEAPSMHGENKTPLRKGMCFTIEPGIYVPEVAGVRIEDMIFMTSKGAEVLTQYPKTLQIVS
ncbi:Xaa-Pro dipeptidase [Lentibacillus sp. JNUCC-1]|uniref:M24 family metallopeptidase n=1 Tax=Lentibacillus sp. JNUCC-1 TaxID=2654513 RepID=UPI0012E7CE89|nr:Xaa-Pro peptidase family protein [Lentibacillus sp. JNUCC-1]MUV39323.1 Xaa-Pro dipeptidase [Lentibacillus sp. JNUCC-1]